MFSKSRLVVCFFLTFILTVSPVLTGTQVFQDTELLLPDLIEMTMETGPEPIPYISAATKANPLGFNTFFSDDMESGNPGFTVGQDIGATQWNLLSNGAHSGSFSWDFGNGNYNDPASGGLSWLISPEVTISAAATDAELSFWHWRDFESNSQLYDGGNVKISTTGVGGPWTLILPTGGYDGPAESGYDNPLAGEPVYGNNNNWENVSFDLGAHIGETINLRWDAGADNYATNDAGWRIDDILVTGNTPDSVPIPLSVGWNLISIPMIQTDTSLGAVLGSIAGQWDCVMAYNASDTSSPWESNSIYRPDALDELWDIDHKIGVWLSVTSPCTLYVNGVQPVTVRIPLLAGWNLVGYPSHITRNATDTLPLDMVDKVAIANLANPYLIEDTSDLASVQMLPGNGYWVHCIADTYWDIDSREASPIRNIAEFEPMQGVLIRYPLGIPYALIAEMSENDTVYTLVANTATRDTAISNYGSNGVNMANCEWIITSSDSYWTRDYGPWWITDENDEIGIVDFNYNRPRPNDNAIPGATASYLGVPLDFMSIDHTGGNYMTDGMGISISTDLIATENPGYTRAQIEQLHYDHLGIDTYHIEPDANGEYIEHIDCWAKFLDADKIMIREVPPAHPRYTEIESAAANFSSYISSYGTPYEVYRVYTPNDEPYTNCLILNDKVLLPIMGGSWDAAAVASWQAAMPGYEVVTFTGTWESTDALHCRAKGIPDIGMLYIEHYPVIGTQVAGESIEIVADITAFSGTPVTATELYWKLSTDVTYNVLTMAHVTGEMYRTFIPGQTSGSTIQYYIQAEDGSGRLEIKPFMGIADPHEFDVA